MTTTAGTLSELVDELRRRTGLRTHVGRLDALRAAIDQHVAVRGTAIDIRDPEILDALIDVAAIDESYFFRHAHQLEFLRSTVLPRLIDERPAAHTLRLWSAGCADGEEAYTLAILLAEEGLERRADVLATDVSAGALARARQAAYTPWALRSQEIAARGQLFEPAEGRQRLVATVREQVTFRQHNLLDAVYPRPEGARGFDVILCRNVLVHLEREAVAAVIPRLVDALAPGGWLLTAPADPPPLDVPGVAGLEPLVLPAGGLVYRRRDPADHPAPDLVPPLPHAHRTPRPARPADRWKGPSPRARAPRAVATPPPPPPAGDQDADGSSRCLAARDLLASGRPEDALREAQAAAFLAPDLAAAHLTLGLAAEAADRPAVAGRAFRRAAELLDARPADEPVELCDGELAGRLADLARAHALLARERAT